MKSMMRMTVLVLIAAAAFSAAADGWAVFDGGWRISAGAVYDFGAKATGRMVPRQGYVSPYRAGLSRQQAEQQAGGTRSGSRVDFANGAWIDSNDPVCEGGDDLGKTRYYHFPSSAWNANSKSFILGSESYSEVDTIRPIEGSFDRSFSDESGMLGVNVELSRNLYHDEEYGWGVDAAIGFQYFKHNGLLSIASSWFNGSSSHTYGTRAYGLKMDGTKGTYSERNWRDGRSYYGIPGDATRTPEGDYVNEDGQFWNAGPISADLDDLGGGDFSESDASYGSMRADGDYENMELMLLGRPYYDVFDWLRVNATFGLVVSRQDLDFEMAVLRDGVGEYSSHRDFSQWDVYGVAGLGLMLYYKDFTLSADFLARFLDDDLTFEDRYIQGEVQRGRWMFKLSAGYEF